MIKQTLNGMWVMKKRGGTESYPANVPTTMYQVLLEQGKIEDPYIGENDRKLTAVSDDDYVFYRSFFVDAAILEFETVEIEFLGLDTLAAIYLNEHLIGRTNNMHCEYTFEITDKLLLGENFLRVEFTSPNRFIAEEQRKDPLWGIANPLPGYEHLRKAHHMFGWDWGPQLPDMGIWRPVTLLAYNDLKLTNVYITQTHCQDYVGLEISLETTAREWITSDFEIIVDVIDPQGKVCFTTQASSGFICCDIQSPQLWWPNGYGEQPLYTVKVYLKKDQVTMDSLEKRIGLRSVTMTREKDEHGESFDMTINGLRIFAMGADYIPEDILIGRMNKERTATLLEDCKAANFNHIRVWGGAFYPEDYFYDLCDELGLLVWQDFMFACGVYRLTKKFEENITREITQNVRRIRHHACLALWCGNNEMEMAFVDWGLPKDERLRLDYLLMYEKLIPDLLAIHDPNTFYWPASPSSGGGFDHPNGDDKGDVHYWEVFHGNKHYKEFRKHYFRFASEYGMQSFPDIKTIEQYATESERQVYGPVMENHNKCLGDINGNMKIMMNMAAEFNLPSKLDDVVYISQVFQGETIKCAVEHFRRNRGRCMGSTYWQLNDNWPVASWASIDYYGRWKALHYMVKRFYASKLVSAYEQGTKGFIHVSNESRVGLVGRLDYQVRHINLGILEESTLSVIIPPCSTKEIVSVDIQKYIKHYGDERNMYLTFQLVEEVETSEIRHTCKQRIAADSILFVAHKHFNFEQAMIQHEVFKDESGFGIRLTSNVYAKSVGISFRNFDAILSDNYFDLLPMEQVEVRIVKVQDSTEITQQMIEESIDIKAVNTVLYIQ